VPPWFSSTRKRITPVTDHHRRGGELLRRQKLDTTDTLTIVGLGPGQTVVAGNSIDQAFHTIAV